MKPELRNQMKVRLEMTTVEGYARFVVCLPKRWVFRGLLLAALLWGGPEAGKVWHYILSSIP